MQWQTALREIAGWKAKQPAPHQALPGDRWPDPSRSGFFAHATSQPPSTFNLQPSTFNLQPYKPSKPETTQ
jgi:hypothetical protein